MSYSNTFYSSGFMGKSASEYANDLYELQQENEQLKKKYENAVADYELEKYKNSKAIEYINHYIKELDILDLNELLQILGGKE